MRQFVQSRPTVRTLVRGLALTAVVAVAAAYTATDLPSGHRDNLEVCCHGKELCKRRDELRKLRG